MTSVYASFLHFSASGAIDIAESPFQDVCNRSGADLAQVF